MEVKSITKYDQKYKPKMAELLYKGFKKDWPDAWPSEEEAYEEVEECLEDEKVVIGIFDEEDELLGWIGGISQYGGNVWELHPLVVDEAHRKKGYGRILVHALENEVRDRGGITIQLGTDDENFATSLSGVDLYVDLHEKIKSISNIKNHPFEFYQKLGYSIIGVMPDANGLGKPDIYMGKRVGLVIDLKQAKLEDASLISQNARAAYADENDRFTPAVFRVDSNYPSPDDVEFVIKGEKYIYYKILLNYEIIGGVYIKMITDDNYHIEDFCIHPDYHNLGYGFKVLEILMGINKHIKKWTLETPEFSIKNQHIYKKCGFELVGKFKEDGKLMYGYEKNM